MHPMISIMHSVITHPLKTHLFITRPLVTCPLITQPLIMRSFISSVDRLVRSIFDKKNQFAVIFKQKALAIADKVDIVENCDNNNSLTKWKTLDKQLGIPDSTLRCLVNSRKQSKINAFSDAMERQKVRARKYDV